MGSCGAAARADFIGGATLMLAAASESKRKQKSEEGQEVRPVGEQGAV